ncbi:pyridoxamine 5'-phosphate oxidase family protein [bacterium]|nr:pyridoxamine 5'-phosphate oxidase family protein [bacterium]
MRRKDKEVPELEQIEEIIKEAKVCRLGLYEKDTDYPYIVPLNFGYSDKKLYFHSAKAGKKVDILKSNPRVCFEFDIALGLVKGESPCNWGNKFKSVIGFGTVSFLEDPIQKADAMHILMQNYSNDKHLFPEKVLANTLVYVVDIEEITGKQFL